MQEKTNNYLHMSKKSSKFAAQIMCRGIMGGKGMIERKDYE